MNRLLTIAASTVVAGLVGSSLPVWAQSEGAQLPGDERPRRLAMSGIGNLEGVVRDDRGALLAGVTVSALGPSTVTAVTDKGGAFRLRALPAGGYLVRAHRAGYLPSRRELVQVVSERPARFSLTLQRLGRSSDTPSLLAAGMASGSAAEPLAIGPADAADPAEATEDRGETAWRLRHLKRSILKEAERAALDGANEAPNGVQPGFRSSIARAMSGTGTVLADLSINGELNFLTAGSFDGPGPAASARTPLRQLALLSVGGPAWQHGDWSARLMAQGGLDSWYLAGSYRRRAPAAHNFEVGLSYSSLQMAPGDRWPVVIGPEETRSAGAVFANGKWTVSPRVAIGYAARYARYDYLEGPGLVSSRLGLTLVPLRGLRVLGTASRRMLAPGAEEFLEPLVAGLRVPSERTFLGAAPLSPEGTQHFEVAVERDLPWRYVIALRSFYQVTGHQQVALFGSSPAPVGSTGHYAVGDGGNVAASGWSVGVSNAASPYVRGSIVYTVTDARWLPGGLPDFGLLLVGTTARPAAERLHDLTTAVETDIPFTATRLFVACKVNTGFARRTDDELKSGVETRFDVQVLQRLPFLDFTSAQWQVMLGVRNLFRDAAADASVYDELLVVRPPTRVVTGLLVRF